MPHRPWNAYAFLAFPLAVLLVFTLIPTAAGLAMSVFSWGGAGSPRFVGLENYRALAHDAAFGPALRNTLVFTLATVPVTVVGGFLLAVALHARWFVGRAFVRTLVFLPTVVSVVAIGFVWRWMLDRQGGLFPALLASLGVGAPDFLQGGAVLRVGETAVISWPMLSIIVVQVWRGVGFCMVLYLAALSGVNESLHEAAQADGASRWRVLRHITWPQVAPMTVFLLITGVIGALQVFDLVWSLTSATETDATRVLNLYFYREFWASRYGYASAIGVVIFTLTAAVTVVPWWWTKRGGA